MAKSNSDANHEIKIRQQTLNKLKKFNKSIEENHSNEKFQKQLKEEINSIASSFQKKASNDNKEKVNDNNSDSSTSEIVQLNQEIALQTIILEEKIKEYNLTVAKDTIESIFIATRNSTENIFFDENKIKREIITLLKIIEVTPKDKKKKKLVKNVVEQLQSLITVLGIFTKQLKKSRRSTKNLRVLLVKIILTRRLIISSK